MTFPLKSTVRSALLLFTLLLAALVPASHAQTTFILSKNADLSTDDRVFSRDDVLYLFVDAPQIDPADLHKNEFRLKPKHGGNDINGAFINHFDGTFTASIPLDITDPDETEWQLRARIRDRARHVFEARVDLRIGDESASDDDDDSGDDDDDGDSDDDDDDGDDDDDSDDDEDDGGDDDDDGGVAVEFEGEITALSASSITVLGLTLEVNDQTRVEDEDGNPLDFAALAVGDFVEVRAVPLDGGGLLATRIRLEDREDEDEEVEVTGPIESLDANGLTVAGLFFAITDETVVLDEDEQPISASELVVGLLVEVKGEFRGTGVLVATRIEIEEDDDEGDEVRVVGEIEAIDDTSITVGGLTFLLTDATRVLDDDNRPIDPAQLAPGMLVEVEGHAEGDVLVADKIKLEDEDDDEVELTGTIDALGADFLVIADLVFFVDNATVILDLDENPIAFEALAVGMLVEIRAEREPGGRLRATHIEIEDQIEDEVEVTGVLEHRTDDTVVVLGQTFRVLPPTLLLDAEGNEIALADFAVGQTVEVRGDLLPGGDLVARRIQIEDEAAGSIYVVGPVETVAEGTVSVIGIHFFVDAATEIFDAAGTPIALAALIAGETVEVEALGLADGTRRAERITVQQVLVVSAALGDVRDDALTILGKTFALDAHTLILGPDNAVLDRSQLAAGQQAQVRSVDGATGAVATKVRLETSASVTTIDPDSATLPHGFVLEANYPNPFNPRTTISFVLDSASPPASVSLTIHDVLGRRVRTLLAGATLSAGPHQATWNGRSDTGAPVASGLYLYRLRIADQVQTRTMTLLK